MTAEYLPQPIPRYAWPATVGPKWSKKIMPWLEQFWHTKKRFPTDSELVQRFGFSEEELFKFHHSKFLRLAMEARGIIRPEAQGFLTPEQVACISLIANVSDTRSEKAKLAAIGVTAEQYNGWMQDEFFKRELNNRVDEMLGNLKPAANQALAREVHKGNFGAIKFYFELTGQSKTPEQINLENALVAVVDILERNVRDPKLLERIGVELHNVLNPDQKKRLPSVAGASAHLPEPLPPVARSTSGAIQGEIVPPSPPVAEHSSKESTVAEKEPDDLRAKFMQFQEELRESD